MQHTLPALGDSPEGIAKTIVGLINDILKTEANGFLHDDQQWRLLTGLLGNDRFVSSVAVTHISPKYLALGTREFLEKRIKTIEELSEQEFYEKSREFTPDPSV